jgi:hypothetical protein
MGADVRRTSIFRNPMTIEAAVGACLKALDASGPSSIAGRMNWFSAQMIRLSPRAFTALLSAAMLKQGARNQ